MEKKIFIDTLTLMMMKDDDELFAKLEKQGFDMKKQIRTECEFGGNWYIQEEQKIMNLKDFLNLQGGLDNIIMQRFKESGKTIENRELLTDKILALVVEVGEFSQELSSFKYWKQGHQADMNKALEEYVDCIFFMLSIANLLGFSAEQIQEAYMKKWNENIRRQKANY